MKKEMELEEKLKLLEKELNLLGEDVDKTRLDLEEAVDLLKIEIESIKITLKAVMPDFQKKFREMKNIVLKEIDPEWMKDREA